MRPEQSRNTKLESSKNGHVDLASEIKFQELVIGPYRDLKARFGRLESLESSHPKQAIELAKV